MQIKEGIKKGITEMPTLRHIIIKCLNIKKISIVPWRKKIKTGHILKMENQNGN